MIFDKHLPRKKFREILIWIILGILIFVPRTADLGHFLGHDEQMRNRQSLDSFLAIAEGRWGDVFSSNFGGTNLTWARTAAKVLHFGWLRLQGLDVSLTDMVNYGLRFDPLPGAIFNALLVVIVYWFVRKLFGWKVAVLATAILALDPFLLSESRILRTEAAYATFLTLATISIALYARTFQRRYLVWCGLWSAWTIATKISGVILGPIIGLVLLVMVWRTRPTLRTPNRLLKRLAIDLLVWGGVTTVCTFAIWPTLWVRPVQTFIDLYDFVLIFGLTPKESLDFFFMGDTVRNLPFLYYLLVLLYKTTPLVWLGLLAFARAIWQSRKIRGANMAPTWAGYPFPVAGGLILLFCAFLYTVAMSLGTFKTERYMMSTVSVLNIVAAFGLVTLARSVYRKWPARPAAALLPVWLSVFVIFFAGHGLFTLLNHPYYFSYYNPLLGGGFWAAKTVQVGSGELVDVAMTYLNNKPDPAGQVVVCGTNLPRCEYASAGQTLLRREALNAVHSDWIAADYVVAYIFQAQRNDYPPGVMDYLAVHPGPEYTATFQGIDYARVYPAPGAQYVVASELTGISTLLGYDLDKRELAAGDSLKIKPYWENDGRIEHDMFIQLTDPDNYVWSETTAPFSPGFKGLANQLGAIIEGEAELPLPIGMPPGRYYLKMGYKTEAGQLIGQFKLPAQADTIEVTLPDLFTAMPDLSHRANLSLDEALTLAGYDLDREQLLPGESLWLTLYWQALEDVRRDYVINLRLLDTTGVEMAYWLGRPVRSNYPTNLWRAGQIVQDPWLLTIPGDVATGQYQLEIVVFDAQTRQAVNQAFLQPIRVVPERTYQTQRPPMQFESGAQFGESVTLLGYDLYFDVNDSGEASFSPNFYWQSRAELQEAFDILLTLRTADTDQVIKEWQMPLGAGAGEPQRFWTARQVINTVYQLEAGAVMRGRYHLDIALQKQAGGQTEPVKLGNGTQATFARIEDIQDKIVVRVN